MMQARYEAVAACLSVCPRYGKQGSGARWFEAAMSVESKGHVSGVYKHLCTHGLLCYIISLYYYGALQRVVKHHSEVTSATARTSMGCRLGPSSSGCGCNHAGQGPAITQTQALNCWCLCCCRLSAAAAKGTHGPEAGEARGQHLADPPPHATICMKHTCTFTTPAEQERPETEHLRHAALHVLHLICTGIVALQQGPWPACHRHMAAT